MSVWTRRLLGLAFMAALVGTFALAWKGGDLAAVRARLAAQYFGLFGADAGPWRWALSAGGVLLGAALVIGLVAEFWPFDDRPRKLQFDAHGHSSLREALTEVARRISTCAAGDAPNVIAAFDELVRGAILLSASDIHLSPNPQGLRLTYRVQGTLQDVTTLDPSMAPLLVTRVKVLARLDTYIHGTPQDGRLVMYLDSGTIEARVSTLPTESGERVVLRLVRGSLSVPDIESLALSPEVETKLYDVLSRPQGLLFVTGPVGSGKTTTLYAAMHHISRTRGATTTLVTLEDPIELQLPFATQTQMNSRTGMTFAGTLRSVLRQDPNVLMLGEIRDKETAEIAMQAALTGHLLLTTVHGESAAGPFARLIEMDVEPFVLASATLGCLSQRLVRTLCTACRRAAPPEPMHRERFLRHGIELPDTGFYEPVGCTFCEHQGFTGRTPIAEVLVMDGDLRAAVNQRKTTREIHDLAMRGGMTSLLQCGLDHAARGDTSLTEVLRVAG